MKILNRSISQPARQGGTVLVISLLLLVVITTLAISGMNTATTELALARNDQNYEFAFQAAETGLDMAMAQRRFPPSPTPTSLGVGYVSGSANDEYETTLTYEGNTLVPDKAFSLGVGSGVAAHHFLAASQAKSSRAPGSTTDRDSSALHTQAFYVVGREDPTL